MAFNSENKSHLGKKSKLFLGEPLGILDTVNVQYPKLEALYQTQLSQIWNEFEVDLTQDKQDMQQLPKETVDLMVKSLMWQTAADSVASRSIHETIGKFCTNSELSCVISAWSFFETIHARTYSHIIKQTFVNPNELFGELYADAEVMRRSELIFETFERVANLDEWTSEEKVKDTIIQLMFTLACLESVAFMGSFAVTFGIAETGKFNGIAQLVKLVCRDELLHARMSMTTLDYLKADPEWSEAMTRNQEANATILSEVVSAEARWADYLFSEGRKVIGLNAELLKDYTCYISQPLERFTGWEPSDMANPLKYMDKYVDSSKYQAAAQEIQLTNYRIGAIEDDTDGLEFD
jgi:ribonucleoside-diphosphate reductase beta chain